MAFDKSKKNQSATKIADNLNDLCKKLNTAIQRKKDLKASKFIEIYDRCCILRSQLEGLATKLLDAGNTKDFEYVANISHRSSKILSSYEKLTSRPNYQPSLTNYTNSFNSGIVPNNGENASNNLGNNSEMSRSMTGQNSGNLSAFNQANSAGTFQTNFANFENTNATSAKGSKDSTESDWARFDDDFNTIQDELSGEGREDFKGPGKEGLEGDQRGAMSSKLDGEESKYRGGRVTRDQGNFREERRYKKDYLDSNMDTSIDYFNTSMDLHNYDYYNNDYEVAQEKEIEVYPMHLMDSRDGGRGSAVDKRGDGRVRRVMGKKGVMATERETSAPNTRGLPTLTRPPNSPTGRFAPSGTVDVTRASRMGVNTGKVGNRFDPRGIHDRDHTSDRYRDSASNFRYREEQERVGGRYREDMEDNIRRPKDNMEEYEDTNKASVDDRDFILKERLKKTINQGMESQNFETTEESDNDMVDYIKMLEKFLQMTKFNSVINRISEHEDDYKSKLSSLKTYYNDTYDALNPVTTKTGVNHPLGGSGIENFQTASTTQTSARYQNQSSKASLGVSQGNVQSTSNRSGVGVRSSQIALMGNSSLNVNLGKEAYRDETKLYGKEIEPLWRSESDGGLSNYLGEFLVKSEYKLIKTSKYEVHLDLNQLNREDFILNLQLYFVAKINIASLDLTYINLNETKGGFGGAANQGYRQHTGSNTNASSANWGAQDSSIVLSSRGRSTGRNIVTTTNANPNSYPSRMIGDIAKDTGVLLVDERPINKDNNFTINLKIDLNTVIDFPLLVVKLIENDGNKSELKLLLPIGIFLSLVPLKYKLNQFEAFWNSMELTVNRQIRLFLSKMPVDLNNLINLLWKFFSVYLQEDVLLLSSCGTEVLLGSVFIKQSTLIVVQLRCICNNLITSTMNLLKEVFSCLSIKYDPSISNYTLKRVSSLPLNFQSNLQLNTVVKSIANYQ